MPYYNVTIPGPAGVLEAVMHLPATENFSRVGIVCHPHPLQQGTMHNKVVTTVVKTFNSLGIPCVRFNYRGVGNSSGEYGEVVGEVADCLAVVNWLKQKYPHAELYLAGFSFGAYIAAETASKVETKQLISIAPAVERMPYAQLPSIACPWLVIQGEDDDVVTPDAVYAWFETLMNPDKTLIKVPGAGHFFHGKLVDMQRIITNSVQI